MTNGWPSLDDAEVGDQRLVEDRVDTLALVAAPFALASQPDALGGAAPGRWACAGQLGGHVVLPYL